MLFIRFNKKWHRLHYYKLAILKILPIWFSQVFLCHLSSWNVRLKLRGWFFAGCIITCDWFLCSSWTAPGFMWVQLYSFCRTRGCNKIAASFPLIVGRGRYYNQLSDHFPVSRHQRCVKCYCQQRVRKVYCCLLFDI